MGKMGNSKIGRAKITDAKLWYKCGETSKTRADDFAGEILENGTSELFSIQKITRRNSYNVGHTGKTKNEESNRIEERIALEMFGKDYAVLGKILDYQVPLKNSRNDKGVGKIDLISYDKDELSLTLLELKKTNSDETLLRATLEVFTYWKIADHQKLLFDFNIQQNITIKKAVLLFGNSYAYNEYVNKTSPNTIQLMEKLDIGFYGIDKVSGGYEVFIP